MHNDHVSGQALELSLDIRQYLLIMQAVQMSKKSWLTSQVSASR